MIGDGDSQIEVKVISSGRTRVKIGIEVPNKLHILRAEIQRREIDEKSIDDSGSV